MRKDKKNSAILQGELFAKLTDYFKVSKKISKFM